MGFESLTAAYHDWLEARNSSIENLPHGDTKKIFKTHYVDGVCNVDGIEWHRVKEDPKVIEKYQAIRIGVDLTDNNDSFHNVNVDQSLLKQKVGSEEGVIVQSITNVQALKIPMPSERRKSNNNTRINFKDGSLVEAQHYDSKFGQNSTSQATWSISHNINIEEGATLSVDQHDREAWTHNPSSTNHTKTRKEDHSSFMSSSDSWRRGEKRPIKNDDKAYVESTREIRRKLHEPLETGADGQTAASEEALRNLPLIPQEGGFQRVVSICVVSLAIVQTFDSLKAADKVANIGETQLERKISEGDLIDGKLYAYETEADFLLETMRMTESDP